MEHSKLFSPSSYKFNKICPARVVLSLQVVQPEDPNEAAVRGTIMHDIGDKILQIRLAYALTEAKKLKKIKKLYGELLDDREIEIVDFYVDNVIAIREKFLSKVKGKFIEVFEERLTDSKDSYGTVDYGMAIVSDKGKGHIVVSDLKTGRYDVEIEANEQLSRYALMMAASKLPEGVDVASCHLVIYQPVTDSEPKIWKCDAKYLDEFRKEFEAHKKQVYRMLKEGVEDSDYNVTEHCQFCPAIGLCPKQLEAREKELEEQMELLPDVTSVDVSTIPIEKRVKIFQATKTIKKFLDAVGSSILEDGLKGKETPGYKVVGSTQKRGWRKDIKVSEVAKELRALGAKSVTKSSLIGIGEIEKQIGKDKSLIEHLVEKNDSRPCIAKETDKREPWVREVVGTELLD